MTENNRVLSRRQFLRLTGAAVLGSALVSCGMNPTKEVKPTATPSETFPITPGVIPTEGMGQEGTQGSEVNPVVEQAEKSPAIIEVGVWYERDSEDPTIERIKFALPGNLTEGNNPAIKEGDSVIIGFFVDTEVPLKKVLLSSENVIGIDLQSSSESDGEDATRVWGGWVIDDFKMGLNAVDGERNRIHKIEDPNKVLEKMLITGGPVGGRHMVRFELPNLSYFYTDERGSREINPFKRFSSGEMALEVRRMEKPDEGVVVGPLPPITISGIEIGNGNEIVAQCPYKIEAREPIKISIQTDGESGVRSPSTVGNQNETVQAKPAAVEEGSRWTQTDWKQMKRFR